MLLYVYRQDEGSLLDFSARRVEGDGRWPFECHDVKPGGVAYCAGLREGDRLSGYSDFDAPGHKKSRDWGDETLASLNSRDPGTLFLLFVDKRAALSEEEEGLVKKRLDFISARKSNLKALNRLHELPKFVLKWDKKNANVAGGQRPDGSAEDLQSPHPQPRLHTMRLCLYEFTFAVRELSGPQYEVYGVDSDSLAYRVGIRNGDYVSGFNYLHEDGRAKSHIWQGDTLNELQQLGMAFVLIQKKERLGEAEERLCAKRDKYVSQIKSKFRDTNQLHQCLGRLPKWDQRHAGPQADPLVGREPTIHSDQQNTGKWNEESAPSTIVAAQSEKKDDPNPDQSASEIEDMNARSYRPHVEGCSLEDDNKIAAERQTSSDEGGGKYSSTLRTRPSSTAANGGDSNNDSDTNSESFNDSNPTIQGPPQREGASPYSTSTNIAEDQNAACCVIEADDHAPEIEGGPTPQPSSEITGLCGNKEDSPQSPHVSVDTRARLEVGVKRDRSASGSGESRTEKRYSPSSDKTKANLPRKRVRRDQDTPPQTTANEDLLSTVPPQRSHADFDTLSTLPEMTTQTSVYNERPHPLSTESQQERLVNDGLVDNGVSATAAAKEFLLAVLSKTDLTRVVKFPSWELRLLEILGKTSVPPITAQLDMTVTLLRPVRKRLDTSSMTLDQCVDWIVRAIERLPGTSGGDIAQVNASKDFKTSISVIQERFTTAQKASGLARDVTHAWTEVIDAVLEAVSVLKTSLSYQQQKLVEWKRWSASAEVRLQAQREELTQLVAKCIASVSRYELDITSAEKKMASLESALQEEIQKAEIPFSRLHRERAAAGDFVGCARLRKKHQKALSANQQIASLQTSVAQCYTEVHFNAKEANTAREIVAFCENLRTMFHSTEDEHVRHVERVMTTLKVSSSGLLAYVQQELRFIGSTLIQALENYFDRSYQMQKDALDALKVLREEQAVHDAKFGGYIVFDASSIERYEKVAALFKSRDVGVINKQALLWQAIQTYLPEERCLFAFAALDERLNKKHGELWCNIKEPLQEAIDATSSGEPIESMNVGEPFSNHSKQHRSEQTPSRNKGSSPHDRTAEHGHGGKAISTIALGLPESKEVSEPTCTVM